MLARVLPVASYIVDLAREHVMLRYVAAYSPGDALNAILNYWVEELRMNYVALAIALD